MSQIKSRKGAVSRLLVVDASVLHRGGNLGKGTGICASLLEAIQTVCHKVVLSKEISKEWDVHQSPNAYAWRAIMMGKGKLMPMRINSEQFETQIEQCVPLEHTAKKTALRKDAHLLAAAYAADKLLLTADKKLLELCKEYGVAQNIEWLEVSNPSPDQERQQLLHRLVDLATTRPNPPLPA
jgi:predicted nuclease of predicted toxin-antitoxin system